MKNRKLTVKKVLVVVLAAILFGLCITPSSYSWFTRPKLEYADGKAMNFTIPNSVYYAPGASTQTSGAPKAYAGNGVTMATYLSTNDGVSFSDTAAAPATSGTLGTTSPSNRIYYKTTITNSSGTEQNVSLYIKNFTPSGNSVCVGTNVPIKAFKNYSMYGVSIPSPTRNQSDGDKKRVYFEPVGRVPSGNNYDSHRTTWANKTYYVFSSTDGSSFTRTTMTVTPNYSGIYYADINWDHNQCYFACAQSPANYQRTQTFTNLYGDGLTMTQSLLFYTNGTYTDYNNAWAGKEYCTGASFAHYYKDITIAAVSGQSINVGLTRGTDYQANSNVTYTRGSTAFTVTTAGVITPNTGISATTTTTLRYRATSYYGDYRDQTVNVTVKKVVNTSAIKAAPIVTNLLLAASGDHATQDVYWFIQNGDEMYGQASGSASYTLDGIYLGV